MQGSNQPAPHINGDHHNDEDDIESGNEGNVSPASSSSSMEQLRPGDFPSHFSERDGRLFPSGPYPLPVDTPEQERLTLSHNILNQLIGRNYVGPVLDILNEEDGRQKAALDLCTGNGKWVIDMAAEYPHVHFTGIDIVPIATQYPPANVRFEVHDVNERLRWTTNTFDLVHGRSVSMAARDYGVMLQEVARVSRPRGIFISYEWGRYAAFDPSLQRDPSVHAPASWRFFNALNTALASRGILPIAAQIPAFLAASGLFTEITPTQYYVPIGSWNTDATMRGIGAAFVEVHERYADSVRSLLGEAGWAQQDVENMVSDYVQEIKTVHGLVSVLYTVHARRA